MRRAVSKAFSEVSGGVSSLRSAQETRSFSTTVREAESLLARSLAQGLNQQTTSAIFRPTSFAAPSTSSSLPSPSLSHHFTRSMATAKEQPKKASASALVAEEEADESGRKYALTDKIPQKPVTVVEATGYSFVILLGWGFLFMCLYFLFTGAIMPSQPANPYQQNPYGRGPAGGYGGPTFGGNGPAGWGR